MPVEREPKKRKPDTKDNKPTVAKTGVRLEFPNQADGPTSGRAILHTPDHEFIESYAVISSDDVRKRAYELYEQRGRHEGHHEADWFNAESELRMKLNSANEPERKKAAQSQKRSA